MRNKVLAKCTTDIVQLVDRRERGAKYVEIHLRDGEPWGEDRVREMTRNVRESGLKVISVHAPMNKEFQVESFGNVKAWDKYQLICQFAQNMHEIHGEDVIIVVHQELTIEQISGFGLLPKIIRFTEKLLKMYPNIKIGLENAPILCVEGGKLMPKGSFYEAPVKLAEHLRGVLDTDRVGTVLDTCNIISSTRIINELNNLDYDYDIKLPDVDSIYKDTVILVHLSNSINIGFGKKQRECFESNADTVLLHSIITRLRKGCYTGPITLEVVEPNPERAENYTELLNKLKIRFEPGLL